MWFLSIAQGRAGSVSSLYKGLTFGLAATADGLEVQAGGGVTL